MSAQIIGKARMHIPGDIGTVIRLDHAEETGRRENNQ